MKFSLIAFVSLLPAVAYSIGAAGDTAWPTGATVQVQLKLSATLSTNSQRKFLGDIVRLNTNGQYKISGDIIVQNTSGTNLTIQNPHNRLVLAFVVFDPLGRVVAPVGRGHLDPAFRTQSLAADTTYTHHFDSLDFLSGGARLGYDLSPGKMYRVVAVYRPAGPNGPGFTSQETTIEIPQ